MSLLIRNIIWKRGHTSVILNHCHLGITLGYPLQKTTRFPFHGVYITVYFVPMRLAEVGASVGELLEVGDHDVMDIVIRETTWLVFLWNMIAKVFTNARLVVTINLLACIMVSLKKPFTLLVYFLLFCVLFRYSDTTIYFIGEPKTHLP